MQGTHNHASGECGLRWICACMLHTVPAFAVLTGVSGGWLCLSLSWCASTSREGGQGSHTT